MTGARLWVVAGGRMKVVILCGGRGTRSYPFTEYFPKVMMPIGGTPVVVHLMRIYAQQGFTNFVLAAGHRREILVDYFKGRFQDWGVNVVDTGEDTNTGERIRRCEPYLGDTFLATYGDGLGNVNVNELVAFHKSRNGLATVTSVPLRSQYGTIAFNSDGRVERFQEKPVISGSWINAGYFVLEKRVFGCWTGEDLEAEVLPGLAVRDVLYTYSHHGFWKSMDTSKDQQEFEKICAAGDPPWLEIAKVKAAAAS